MTLATTRLGTARSAGGLHAPVLAVLAAALWLACSTNPATGKREVVLVSTDEEIEIGEEASQQMEQELGILDDAALTEYVQQVGARVAAQSPRVDVQYTFRIIDSPDINAFAFPGGYIYVTRGLLALANSEEELANVLAHEVGHVAARHFARGQIRRQGAGMLSMIGTLAAVALGSGEAAQVMAGLSQVAGAGYVAAYGRDQEREADAIGQTLAARAGYSPTGLADFLRSLDREAEMRLGRRRTPGFLDSHPATPERASRAVARARSLELETAPRIAAGRADFLERLSGLIVGDDPAQGIFVEQEFLHPDFDLRLQFPGGWLTRNATSFVGALSPTENALIKLEIQERGTDVRAAAARYLETVRGGIVQQNGLRIGGLRAYRAVVREAESAVELTWIAHREIVFRMTAITQLERYAAGYRRLFRETADSMRPLEPNERAKLVPVRLDTVTARDGETLEALSARTGNRWTVEETASANAIFAYDPLRAGQLIKVALPKPPSS
jgi:predicted Zn-dependent protease